MASWQTIQSLAIFFAPLLLPKALAFYRSIRYAAPSQITPVPRPASYALSLLFISALISLISTLPLFYPENIFQLTQSRLGTLPGVLFTRLQALRPLTPRDEALRTSFTTFGVDAKLAYLKFGPSTLLDNPLVASPSDPDAERYQFLHAVPGVLAPHLLHLAIVGIATSAPLLGGSRARGGVWRRLALVAACALPAAELYYLASTSAHAANRRSTRVVDMTAVFWRRPVYRGLALAAVDAALGYALWLAMTGRAFVTPPAAGERLLGHLHALEAVITKLKVLGVIRNGIVREPALRTREDNYWRREQEVMRAVVEEPEVLEAQRAALKRLDSVRLGREIDGFVDSNVVFQASPAGTQ